MEKWDKSFIAHKILTAEEMNTVVEKINGLITQGNLSSEDIAALEKEVTTNTEDIATNKANISKNTANIATNTKNIAQNASDIADIAERITGDEEKIAGNTLGISANRALINTNTENIATNKKDIAALGERVTANENDITSLAGLHDDNAADIATNKKDIATNKANIATNTANIETLLNSAYTEDTLSYGVERDLTVSSPTCTRIGNMSLHKTLPIHSKMRGCLLDDNGKVVEYLDAKDWTSATRDGSRGQVMVEIPMHYRKFTLDGNVYSVRISESPLSGYHQVPKMYISAYEAALDRTNNKLASVVNTTAQYRGGGGNADWDDTYRTLLGRPATTISRTNFRKYARNRNAAATSEWNCLTYDAYKAVYWLFVIEYATLNSQADYTAELTTEGYHQGGLGAGVTNWDWTKWGTFNNNYPFVPCGHTDSLGNQTGTVAYTAVDADGAELYTPQVPRYRGIENPFGHLYKWCDGINIRISPNVADGGDGLSKVYVCSDPSLFSDTGYDGYNYVGDGARSNGYIKNIIGGEYGEMIPSEIGGGGTTYYCDYNYTSIPTTEALRGVLFGGIAAHGASAGLSDACSSYAPSAAGASLGSRLCFLAE